MINESNKLAESLQRLRNLNVNIPEILLWAPPPADEEMRVRNVVNVKGFAMLMKPTTGVIIPELTQWDYLDDSQAKEALKDYAGGPLVILKAPKTKPEVEGYCTPGPYYNKIEVGDTVQSLIWGQAFRGEHNRAIGDLTGILQRVRHELDGSKLKFTYHSRGAGLFGDKIVLWGEV